MVTLLFFGLLHSSPLRDCSDQRPCYITAYADAQPQAGQVLDWFCRDHSYDSHAGTDFGIGGFEEMDRGRPVFATAAGTVETVLDGLDDRCTTGLCDDENLLGNHIIIRHEDDSETHFGHLRRNSIRVAEGDPVDCSTQLAEVGSSGASNGPHLHLELRRNGEPIDLFAGDCGAEVSAWRDQGGYRQLPSAHCPEASRDDAQLINETHPEGSTVPPSATIDTTWTLLNAGSDTWGDDVEARLEGHGGWQAPERIALSLDVPVGAELSLNATLRSPPGLGQTVLLSYRLYRGELPFGPRFGVDLTTAQPTDGGPHDAGTTPSQPEPPASGCSCAALDPSLLIALGLLALRRRRP